MSVPAMSEKMMTLIDPQNAVAIEKALAENDLGVLTTPQRVAYYNAVCVSVGLNPLTQPFAYMKLNGKITLYARKECTEQLRKLNSVSTQILSIEIKNDFVDVHIKAKDKTGREDEDFASIYIKGLAGEALANAKMKCITKGKRRVTLSISGLGILDESEIESIPHEAVELTDNPQIPNPLKEVKETLPIPDIPEVLNDAPLGDYVCQVGKKYNGKKLSDIGENDLDKYLTWLLNSSREKNQELSGLWKEFADNAEAYLISRERKKNTGFEENEPMD